MEEALLAHRFTPLSAAEALIVDGIVINGATAGVVAATGGGIRTTALRDFLRTPFVNDEVCRRPWHLCLLFTAHGTLQLATAATHHD